MHGTKLQERAAERTRALPGAELTTLHPGGALDASLVDDLVTESYLLVVENLPAKEQPVDPATFGQRS